MADRRKKSAKNKAVTVTSVPAPKKQRGKEKKPTLSVGVTEAVSEFEKPAMKPVKQKLSLPCDKSVLSSIGGQSSDEKKVEEKLSNFSHEVKPAESKPADRKEKEEHSALEEKPASAKSSRPPRRISVLFVCTGNTCRSAMAQYIFSEYVRKKGESEYFDVQGAGLSALTGDDMSEQAKQALFEKGIKDVNHFARRLTREMAESSDLVVCMTEGHFRTVGGLPNVTTIARITGGADVPDPWGGSLDDYRKVAAYLEYACGDVYDCAIKTVRGAER